MQADGSQVYSGWPYDRLSSQGVMWECSGRAGHHKGHPGSEHLRLCKSWLAWAPQNLVGTLHSVLETHTDTLLPEAFIESLILPRSRCPGDRAQLQSMHLLSLAQAPPGEDGGAALTPGTPESHTSEGSHRAGCRLPDGGCSGTGVLRASPQSSYSSPAGTGGCRGKGAVSGGGEDRQVGEESMKCLASEAPGSGCWGPFPHEV